MKKQGGICKGLLLFFNGDGGGGRKVGWEVSEKSFLTNKTVFGKVSVSQRNLFTKIVFFFVSNCEFFENKTLPRPGGMYQAKTPYLLDLQNHSRRD